MSVLDLLLSLRGLGRPIASAITIALVLVFAAFAIDNAAPARWLLCDLHENIATDMTDLADSLMHSVNKQVRHADTPPVARPVTLYR